MFQAAQAKRAALNHILSEKEFQKRLQLFFRKQRVGSLDFPDRFSSKRNSKANPACVIGSSLAPLSVTGNLKVYLKRRMYL